MTSPPPGTPCVRATHPGARRHHRHAALACALALAGSLLLGACSAPQPDASAPPGLKVTGAYVPQPMEAAMAAGFLTVDNVGGRADTLTSVSTDMADRVELHRTVDRRMERVRGLRVPADGRLTLGRGGNHLMLLDLERKPVKGQSVRLTLHFRTHAPITVKAPVKATNHDPRNAHH